MKKNIILVSSILFLSIYAEEKKVELKPVEKPKVTDDSTPIKIRTIEGRKVLTDSLEGKSIEARLNEKRSELDKQIKELDKEIEKDVTELRGRARTVDQETLEKDQERILTKQKARDAKAEAAQGEFSRTVNRELAKFNLKLKEIVVSTAKSKNWDLVALKETGEVVYASNRIDASNEIIKVLDDKFKTEKTKEVKKVTIQ